MQNNTSQVKKLMPWLQANDEANKFEMERAARSECYNEPGFKERKEFNKSLIMGHRSMPNLEMGGDDEDDLVRSRIYGHAGPAQIHESIIISNTQDETINKNLFISQLIEDSVITFYESRMKLGVMHYFDSASPPDESKLRSILDKIPENASFIDAEFKHQMSSVEGAFPNRLKQEWGRIEWLRAQNLRVFKNEFPKLFGGDPNSEDPGQGSLGNCYYIASLASLAVIPNRITQLFSKHSQIFNQKGGYGVYLCINGLWQLVIVDDYFPTIDKRTPLFAKCQTLKIWPMILEKAYAKVMGGYLNLVSGPPTEALHALTGAPTHTYRVTEQQPEKVLTLINQNLSKNYPMTACSGKDQSVAEGIEKNHAYSVIAIYFLKLLGGGKYELKDQKSPDTSEVLLKIRNPWCNQDKWKGKWSLSDPVWENNMQVKEVIFGDLEVRSDSAVLVLSLQDFLRSFVNFSICECIDAAKSSSVLIMQKNEIKMYEFVVPDSSHEKQLSIGFIQMNPRMHGLQIEERIEFAKVSMVVCRYKSESLKFIKGFSKNFHMMHKTMNLRKGTYTIFLSTNWNSNSNQGVVSFYGRDRIELKQVAKSEPQIIECMEQMFRNMLEAESEKSKYTTYPALHALNSFRYIEKTMDYGYTVYYFVNDHSSRTVSTCVKFLEREGLEFIQPLYKNTKSELRLSIGCNSSELIILRHTDSNVLIRYQLIFEA